MHVSCVVVGPQLRAQGAVTCADMARSVAAYRSVGSRLRHTANKVAGERWVVRDKLTTKRESPHIVMTGTAPSPATHNTPESVATTGNRTELSAAPGVEFWFVHSPPPLASNRVLCVTPCSHQCIQQALIHVDHAQSSVLSQHRLRSSTESD